MKSITHDPATGASNGAVVRDTLTGKEWTIKAKGVINATGACRLPRVTGAASIRASTATATLRVHLLCRRFPAGCFGDAVRKMDAPAAMPLIQGAAGVHIILPDHFSPDK